MVSDEGAHPGGHGGDLPGRAPLDELEVLLHGAVRVRVHVHPGQVRLDQRDQAREYARLEQANVIIYQLRRVSSGFTRVVMTMKLFIFCTTDKVYTNIHDNRLNLQHGLSDSYSVYDSDGEKQPYSLYN